MELQTFDKTVSPVTASYKMAFCLKIHNTKPTFFINGC